MGTGRCIPREEVAARLAFVEDRLAHCVPTRELVPAFRAKFGTGARAALRYVQRVRERWETEGKTAADRAAKRAELEAMVRTGVHQALGARKPRDAAPLLKLLADLHGLTVQRHEHSGPDGAPLLPDVDALADRIAALAARGAGGADP